MGHNRHFQECKARFDEVFSYRGEPVGPTPRPIGDETPEPVAPDNAASSGYAPTELMDYDEVPECPPDPDVRIPEEEPLPALVTRQLPRSEVLARPDALDAIKKEFEGIGNMGTWDLDSVEEEHMVRKRAIDNGTKTHLADLLAICSEKHVELEPQ